MKTIWKFPLVLTDMQEIVMPKDAEILDIQEQHDALCMWALVDPAAEKVSVAIRCYGTGHDVPDNVRKYAPTVVYLATVQQGSFVWHFFME